LICGRDPCIDKQNTDLVIWPFFALLMRPSHLRIEREFRGLYVLRLLNAGLVYETRIWVSRLKFLSMESRRVLYVSLVFES